MLVQDFHGGSNCTDIGGATTDLSGYSMKDLQVGDILFLGDVSKSIYWTAIYYGDNTFLIDIFKVGATSTYELKTFEDDAAFQRFLQVNELDRNLWLAFFVFRPAQSYWDINAQTLVNSNEEKPQGEAGQETEPVYNDPLEKVTRSDVKLDADHLAKLKALTAEQFNGVDGVKSSTFSQYVYNAIGIDLSPWTQSKSFSSGYLKSSIFTYKTTTSFLVPEADIVEDDDFALYRMIVFPLHGGKYAIDLDGLDYTQYKLDEFEAGDILWMGNISKSEYWCCVYQGDNTFLCCSSQKDGTHTVMSRTFADDADLQQFLQKSEISSLSFLAFFVLRPSRAFTDINASTLEALPR